MSAIEPGSEVEPSSSDTVPAADPPAAPPPKPPAAPSRRTTTLESLARVAGKEWAREAREKLHSEDRRASGGWPHTISEARVRVATHLLPELSKRGFAASSRTERDEAASLLYRSARDYWMEWREPDE